MLLSLGLVPAPADAAKRPKYHDVCSEAAPPYVACQSESVDKARSSGRSFAGTPTGLTPAQVKLAYSFPTDLTAGAGKTIAVTIAYNAPRAEKDLNVFSKRYGLPPCKKKTGCFRRVNQNGQTKNYPDTDPSWALEAALDVQWAHAIAPGASILLVEANSNTLSDLMVAVDYAKTHAQYVSNSWDTWEFDGETAFDAHFVQPGVSFFNASGDDGAGPHYPASSPNVIAVGGTTLNNIGSPSFSETAWAGTSGGCSALELATPAQASFPQYPAGCGGRRATPDVSLVGDIASGVSVYTSTTYQGWYGWFVVGGTSVGAPMWAARAATAGAVVDAAYVYGNNIAFRDITVGSNGFPAGPGFDLVTGRGSWTG